MNWTLRTDWRRNEIKTEIFGFWKKNHIFGIQFVFNVPCDRVTNKKNMEYYLNRNGVYTAKEKYVNFFRMDTITAFSTALESVPVGG